ncbi:MAG: T9SS type A sorting domain-containing protein, partial [Rhodothermales bacterium]|nr:T9SS type A sorting domain-containing protein [Rhodothermales bacterium]
IEEIAIHFFLHNKTKIYDLRRNEVALADMQVGQTVIVNAEGQQDGTRLAKSIQLLDVVVSSGELSLSSDGSVSVLGVRYEVAEDALIVSGESVVIDGGTLADGMFVEIRGSQVDEGVFTITKVKVLSAVSVGNDEAEGANLPEGILLGVNYPNPFSSTTTIEFALSGESGSARTDLAIFDLTGRQVRTLIEATMTAGSYSVTWDGRDDAGRPVASGLYFYRVRSGDRSTARTMMLVR